MTLLVTALILKEKDWPGTHAIIVKGNQLEFLKYSF
jgi:hypothetical protein